MARRPRLDAPGSFHHVWSRGVDRRDVFLDDLDRRVYLDRLSVVLPAEGVACFAWALLSNHVHLVLRSGDRPISKAMHRVGTAYAGHFNARHGHEGHVFERRFGSRLVRDEGDLCSLVRYVHRNPFVARLVDSLDALARFRWSGHAALCGERPGEPFHAVREALALFGDSEGSARAELKRRMASCDLGVPAEVVPDAARAAFERLIRETCDELGADEWEVRNGRRSREASLAREAIARIARRELGLADRVVADALGVSRQALWNRIGPRHAPTAGT